MLYTMEFMAKALVRLNKGVLTSKEAMQRTHDARTLISFSAINHKVFFFSDDHCFGSGKLPKWFVPSTSTLPMHVVPRPSLPDGWIKNTEDYIKIFYQDYRQITSMEELVEFLNTTIDVPVVNEED